MRKLLLLILLTSQYSFAQSLESDRLALVAIYNSMEGANWFSKTNWTVPGTTGDSPCGWYGVTCEGGRVTGLNLSNNNVGGTIPAAIGNLTALKNLDFSFSTDFELPEQRITGNIPPEIGNLVNLENLNLAGVMCDGTIPASIGNLTQLKSLDLHFVAIDAGFTPYGNLSGSIPAEIGNLTELEYLDLSSQNFTGALPAELGNLVKLQFLYLLYNNFSGALPASLGNLVELKHFYLSYSNYLRGHPKGLITGTIPSTFANLAGLQVLDLDNQSLTGPMPDILGIPVSAYISILNNNFNFEGMEANISRLDVYAPQALIDATLIGPLCVGCIPTQIRPNTGGTIANLTHKLYKGDVLIRTVSGVNMVDLDGEGIYRVETTNSLVPGLTLVTKNYVAVKLPVTLVSFDGKFENNQTKLTWKTTSETNNKGFEIERSADARSFEKIGFVDGNGDSKEVNTYHFTDLSPLFNGYYRLKQLDHDGKFEYSKIIIVKGSRTLRIYPNPASDHVIVSGIDGVQDLQVVNEAGMTVLKTQASATKLISIQSLKPGLYAIKIGTEAARLLISK